jgi:hypothetical protein
MAETELRPNAALGGGGYPLAVAQDPAAASPARRSASLGDALLYAGAAILSLGVGLGADIPLQREWGRVAAGPYAAGALVALILVQRRASSRARAWLAVAVFTGATLVPMALEVSWRAGSAPGFHAQSEVIVTEEAAAALTRGRNPYGADFSNGPLASRPPGTRTHVPYPPAMLLFGLPRALFGRHAWTDARVAFLVATLAAYGLALRHWPRGATRPEDRPRPGLEDDAGRRGTAGPGSDRYGRALRAFQVLLVLPTGAFLASGPADDLPILCLIVLAGVLAEGDRPILAGLAAGLAAACKQTAWPLLPFMAVGVALARSGGARPAPVTAATESSERDAGPGRRLIAFLVPALAVPVAVTLPFLVWGPGEFWEDVVRFPLGLGRQRSPAGTPTLGHLLVRILPSARTAVTVALVLLVGAFALLLLVRRPAPSPGRALWQIGLVLAVAIVLAPAARFGYAVYPIDLLACGWLLRPAQAR